MNFWPGQVMTRNATSTRFMTTLVTRYYFYFTFDLPI